MVRVLFVCMGNICRSPTAEAVFRHYVERAGLAKQIQIDSVGTHDYHVGDCPDPRSQQAAAKRGYDMSALRGRHVSQKDFEVFDYVLAMDKRNLKYLEQVCPPEYSYKLDLFMTYRQKHNHLEVPDPYYGGVRGFELVLDMIEDAAQGLLDHICRNGAPAGLIQNNSIR